MGYRYGRGDDGYTDLMGGDRVRKSHVRVNAYGAVDELSSVIGVAKTFTPHEDIRKTLTIVQEHLFIIGANLSSRKRLESIPRLGEEEMKWIEEKVREYENELPPATRFIFAGGTRESALLHMARSVARRVEREVVALADVEEVDRTIIAYLNRLSTLLFALARVVNKRAGVSDDEWRR